MRADSRIVPGLDLAEMKAARFYALSWLMSQVNSIGYVSGDCLDFGCGMSPLPSMLRPHVGQIYVLDRIVASVDFQKQTCRAIDAVGVNFLIPDSLQLVTSVFSVQHNDMVDIGLIAQRIGRSLRDGGSWLYVGSYAKESRYQSIAERRDPQHVLSRKAVETLIVEMSGCSVIDERYFSYQHGTTNGQFCDADSANAICLHLKKTQISSLFYDSEKNR